MARKVIEATNQTFDAIVIVGLPKIRELVRMSYLTNGRSTL